MEQISTKDLSGPNQLVQRNREKLVADNILIIGCSADEAWIFSEIGTDKSEKTFLCFEYGEYLKISKSLRASSSSKSKAVFDFWHRPDKPVTLVIAFVQKSSRLLEYITALSSSVLKTGGRLVLVGENKSGIRQSEKNLEKNLGSIVYHDSARHSQLFIAEKKNNNKPDWSDFITSHEIDFKGVQLVVKNLPGVFSLDKFDKGTELLLRTLEEKDIGGKILDFGCGSGLIGTFIKKRSPISEVNLVDSNALALKSSALTAEANNIVLNGLFPSDIFSDITEKYDLIISNPPFHKGLRTKHDVSQELIKQSRFHLTNRGKLRIVGNVFLRYEDLMKKTFDNTRVIASNPYYTVSESFLESPKNLDR